MNRHHTDRIDREAQSKKLKDKAALIPIIGMLFLIPPIAGIFQIDAKIFGIPFTLLYLFIIWAGLIIGTSILSKSLVNRMSNQSPQNSADRYSEDASD